MNRDIERKIIDLICVLSGCVSFGRSSLGLLDHLNDASKELLAIKKLAALEIQEELNNENT